MVSMRLMISREIIAQNICPLPQFIDVNRFHTPAEYKLIDTYDCVSIDVAGYSAHQVLAVFSPVRTHREKSPYSRHG